MAHRKSKGDVTWYPIDRKKKRPIAYSTTATSNLIGLLAEDHETIQDVYNAINYDDEAKNILEIYINLGYGGEIARKHFRH